MLCLAKDGGVSIMAGVTLTVTLLLLAAACVSSEKLDFKGYELLSVYTRDIEDAKVLLHLGQKYPQLDFWSHPAPELNSTVLVPPLLVRQFKDALSQERMGLTILSDDVQSMVDAGSKRTPEAVVQSRNRASGHVIDHYNYHTYTKISNYLSKLTAKYRKHTRVSTLKQETYEGRPVYVVKLSGTSGSKKPAIIVEAGIHAREWISPASVLWVMEKLLRDYVARKPEAVRMLDKYDWYVVPVLNPDGYEFTHTKNRMWRKNRRYIWNGCHGVDLNRNFDIVFGTTGVSHNCVGETYPGESAFSEAESSNIRDLFHSLYQRVVAYVSVHSFSQVVLVPWGFSEDGSRPNNHVELDRVTNLMTQAISQTHGKVYRQGTASQLLYYAASGASEDWALAVKPGIIALCLELRPTQDNKNGFVLPPDQIVPTGEEVYAGLQVMAQEMRV